MCIRDRLGTHFNVEAYEKEDRIAATLVEGKIGFIYSSDNGSKMCIRDSPYGRQECLLGTGN